MRVYSFRSKRLGRLYQSGNERGFTKQEARKLRLRLSALEQADSIGDILELGLWHTHLLNPKSDNRWSIHVTDNYRLVFTIKGDELYDLDYTDYH